MATPGAARGRCSVKILFHHVHFGKPFGGPCSKQNGESITVGLSIINVKTLEFKNSVRAQKSQRGKQQKMILGLNPYDI